ncbi:MAG: 30S ribosomal protein S8 [Gammaproteobacteria bacterium]|jgi:small subunit ribosomal protein S8|nr:30S ribosomal protein S8 [Gammaproteobacteria bacterium]
MSMSDPIADMLTRVRNAQAAAKTEVKMPSSNMKKAIADVLKAEGYIKDYSATEAAKSELTVVLKYFEGRPVINTIKRVSKPGLRIYKSKDDLPKVLGGLGIAIVSTSLGVMSDKQARTAGQGGEIICLVS